MLWLVPLLPALAAPLLYAIGRRGSPALLGWGAAAIVLATIALALAAISGDWQGSYRWSEQIELGVALSPAGQVFALVVPLIAAPIVLYSAYHEAPSSSGRPLARLIALLLAFVGAMQLLVLASDLLTLLIAWELVGALSWALIAHEWHERSNLRAAAWAFLVTRFGDLGLYIAAAAAFAGSGSFDFTTLTQLDGFTLQLFVAGVALACAAKSAQLPFSPWLFAAMSGPTPVSALLHAATMVAAGVYLIVRLHSVMTGVGWFAPLAIGLGLATALAGGVVACLQGHAKKLLAASTAAHYGLMWLAVGAGYPGAALLHFAAHAFVKAVLFLAVGIAEHHTGNYSLARMRLGRQLPGIALAALIASLALAGVIPLSAAWTKEKIIGAAGEFAPWLAIAAALAGGLSAIYATRLQLLAYGPARYVEAPLRRDGPGHRKPEALALYLLAIGALLLSALAIPAVSALAERLLGIALPAGKSWETAMSLALTVLGIALGALAVRRRWSNQTERDPRWPDATNWLGLPQLAQRGATGLMAGSHALARFDDSIVDAGVQAIAAYVPFSRRLNRFDDCVLDGGIRLVARFGGWLAAAGDRYGEAFSDGLAMKVSHLTGWLGNKARHLQTGQTHHYYTAIAAGLAAVLVILAIGGLP